MSVPREAAYDLLLFCQRNPKPCPLLDVTEPGSWTTTLAPGADLRTDLPGYRVWRDGELVDEPADVDGWWRDDLVAFLIGCSFTFETALLDAGVPVRHLEQGSNVPMYRTAARAGPPAGLRPAGGQHAAGARRAGAAGRAGHRAGAGGARRARCTSATRRRSASPTWAGPTTATR